ncbi:MAG: class I SAM-dependent methyltransferase [Bacteroidales bacterium]|nr:class I SAM-dependent methyltransferase [Bacteroidales bacterium]
MKGILESNYADDREVKPELKFRFKVRAQVVVDAAIKYLKTSSKLNVLDMGSADGKTIDEIENIFNNSRFVGVEFSQELIDKHPPFARNNINLIQGDVTDLSKIAEPGFFDIVSALALLEHLPYPIKAIKEANRILKPGGIFVASCPVPFWDDVSNKLGLLKEDHHETDMTKKLFKKYLLEGGFDFLEYKKFMFAPVSFLPYLHIPISPKGSLKLDRIIGSFRILNFLFVNQYIVGRKPDRQG